MKFPIYLDNQATTPLDPEVLEAMLPWFTDKFGNAASKDHSFGWEAESAVKFSRKKIAEFIVAEPGEVVFTSGATESINLAHSGIAESYASKGRHIITSAVEHNSVLDSLKSLERKGFDITILPVDSLGRIRIGDLEKAIRKDTILVSIMTANNEIGNVYDTETIGRICRDRKVIFHTDASQAIGKISFKAGHADLVSFSAHKIYGPKGTGALYIKNKAPKTRLTPLIMGGGHENGLRSGTLNVPGIVGFGKALEIADRNFETDYTRLASYRSQMLERFTEDIGDILLNGDPDNHLPNNLNICFQGVRSDKFLMNLRNIAVSTGSACTSASLKPSHVLSALGLSDDLAKSSVRFGPGRFNTDEEIDYVIKEVIKIVNKLRNNSPYTLQENTTH